MCTDKTKLYREAKRLFNQTRSGIGYVKLCKALNKAGFAIGETRTHSIMRKLKLVCTQRLSYKSTTKSNHNYGISENILSQIYRKQLESYGIRSSMSDKGNCYVNAVVEWFFGSSKHEWLTNVIRLTREGMINDVNDYIRYYNGTRLHSTLGYQTPNEYEMSQINVCN